MYADCENSWTPLRVARIQSRLVANKQWAEKISKNTAERFSGVLPKGNSRHQFVNLQPEGYWAGILFSNGEVHTFDRDRWEHYDYAVNEGKPEVACGTEIGSADGWGFYVREREGEFFLAPYKLPDEFIEAVAEVIGIGVLDLDEYVVPFTSDPWDSEEYVYDEY